MSRYGNQGGGPGASCLNDIKMLNLRREFSMFIFEISI